MADIPLGGSALPFNIAGNISATAAMDGDFLRLHATWRQLEDDFEAQPFCPDESEEAAVMLDDATAARDAMFRFPVWTAAALLLKLEACEEGGSGTIEQDLGEGLRVFGALLADCRRLVGREAGYDGPEKGALPSSR